MGEPTRQRPRSQMVEVGRPGALMSWPGSGGATIELCPSLRGAPVAAGRAGEAVGP